MKKQTILYALAGFGVLLLAALACDAGHINLDISGQPQYICPSSTPRPTDTPFPTSPPTFPVTIQANLDYEYVDVTRSTVNVQYIAQSVGAVQVNYSGVDDLGQPWAGSGGFFTVANAPYGQPGISGSFPITLPSNIIVISVFINGGGYGSVYSVIRYPYPYYASPNPFPCCLASPVYPTPVPTYTPYPTPTEYVRTNDYFLGDPVYTTGTLLLRFRVTSITGQASSVLDPNGQPQNIYIWQLEVTNLSQIEYDFFPAAQMYVSEIIAPGGSALDGVWGASLEAAQAAGVAVNYDPAAVEPGQVQTFTLAAFGPVGTVYRLSFALDSSERGSGPTQVPGANIVSWLNAVNTVCEGNIQEP